MQEVVSAEYLNSTSRIRHTSTRLAGAFGKRSQDGHGDDLMQLSIEASLLAVIVARSIIPLQMPYSATIQYHTQLAKTSFENIVDLTAEVWFSFFQNTSCKKRWPGESLHPPRQQVP